MYEYRVVRPIDPHNVIEADGDKPAKAVAGYKVGDVIDPSSVDPDVLRTLCERNLVNPVVVPDRARAVAEPASAPPSKAS